MSLKDDALQIIDRYFLSPGDAVQEVIEDDLVVTVQIPHWHWNVSRMSLVNRLPVSAGYRLYGIYKDFIPVMDGAVAMLPDGRMFRIDDKAEFLAFFSNARHLLAPLELSGLLASYQSSAEGHENVLVEPEDVSAPTQNPPFLTAKQLASFGVAPPVVTDWSGPRMQLCFYTRFSEDVPGAEPKMSVNRWHVELDAEGQLTWRVEPVARRVDSPFYKGEE